MANVIKPLWFWVQKVLPLVYDDSLSYYEVLEKAILKLNELIELYNEDKENLQETLEEFIRVKVAEMGATAIPEAVNNSIIELMSKGAIQNLIVNTTELVAQEYLASLYDVPTIDYLETVTGEPILTVDGEYILLDSANEPIPLTTNPSSYFYKFVKDARNKIKEGKKPVNNQGANSYLNEPKVLTLLHYSDYHNDNAELNYIYGNWNEIVGLCDDYICTGDMVDDKFWQSFTYFANSNYPAAKKTLLTIGNHDALNDTEGYDWTIVASQQELYDKFFAPTIANWGVTYQAGKTYYYKDYPDESIRLIVLNDMLIEADRFAQLNWLETVALNTDYSVVIAKHYMPPNITKIDCTFTAIDYDSNGYGFDDVPAVVDRFVNNGGKFICYICGHTHYDYIAYMTNYPNQLCITVDAAGREICNRYSDVQRYDDEISRDLFNVIQFDTSSNTIKITRCGCNYDRYLRKKDTLSINYLTKEIIFN